MLSMFLFIQNEIGSLMFDFKEMEEIYFKVKLKMQ